MNRFRRVTIALLVLGFVAATAGGTFAARTDGDGGGRTMTLLDDCDPNGGWEAVPGGGCQKRRGTVSVAEFNAELDSPLSAAVIGHPSWRIEPSYLFVKQGKTLRVKNRGGRTHTFTKVANFGGGNVPPHNEGLVVAPECPASVPIPAGGSMRVSGLTVGSHRFQCCFHPWQRALVEVAANTGRGDDDD